jgi:D-alanine-D-alanine ligase
MKRGEDDVGGEQARGGLDRHALAVRGPAPIRGDLHGHGLVTRLLEPSAGLLAADVVFPALHGPFGEDGTVQGLLELADVPYVGAGVLASALCMDKVVFKDVMAHAEIPQVAYRRARKGDDLRVLDALGLPVFVKPARLGSSVGISKASTADELHSALEEAWQHDPLAIVEALSKGMEVECSVVGNDDPVASEPGELVVSAGCAGLARVDFFVEDGSRVLVNELNTMPGFTQTSVFPKLFEESGLAFPDLLSRLVELAIERHERERAYRF